MTYRRKKKLTKEIVILCVVAAAIIVNSILFVSWQNAKILAEQSKLVSFTYPYPTNSYQWDHLESSGNNMSYEDATYTSAQGIDVSEHQGDIDWKQVAGAGIDFAFIRAAYRGYGSGIFYADDNFDANMQGATANGIDAGIYVFSQAITVDEAAEEADYAIQSAKKYKIDLPIVFDMEGSIDGDQGRVMSITSEKGHRWL